MNSHLPACPPEYNEPHAVKLELQHPLGWIEGFYWTEDGDIVAQLADNDTQRAIGKAEDEGAALKACTDWIDRYVALSNRVDAAQARADSKPMPEGWWADLWTGIHEACGLESSKFDLPYGCKPPKGEKPTFYTTDAEASDPYPLWCSSCETYHQRAYAYDFGKDDDGLFVKVGTWDGDDWDYEYAYEEDAEWLFRHMDSDHYFAEWADYYLHQFHSGLDPLEVWYKVPSDEDILKAVEDNLRYLERDSCSTPC